MSIEDIKDINKLKQMLKSAIKENKYLKACCIEAGEELAKHSFEWDGKEKNLVVQAMELNEKYDKLKAEIDCDERIIDQLEAELSDQEAETLKACEIKHNYKQALQEIKDYCNNYPQNSIGFKQQILQKCEVLKDVK